MSNHQADEAERLITADNGWTIGYETADAQHIVGHIEANTRATLALAYEQRTANLIAAFGQLMDDDTDTFLGERVDGLELAKQIKERLGIE